MSNNTERAFAVEKSFMSIVHFDMNFSIVKLWVYFGWLLFDSENSLLEMYTLPWFSNLLCSRSDQMEVFLVEMRAINLNIYSYNKQCKSIDIFRQRSRNTMY